MPVDRSQTEVAITGIGLVTPYGGDKNVIRDAVLAGESALRWLDELPPPGTKSRGLHAGAPAKYESRFAADPVVEMALQAADNAVSDSGLDLTELDRNRLGCVIGTSKGAMETYANNFRSDAGTASPGVVFPGFQPNTPALRVSRHLDLSGPCLCPIAACATGLQSISRGVQLIKDGYCDVVIAGSSDASLCDWAMHSFNRLGVLANNFSDPANAVRPFAEDRDGFLIGEGAAVMVLERAEDATKRSAHRYAHWLGSACGGDPTGVTQIDESGQILAEVIRRAFDVSGVNPTNVDLLNLHGTGTIPNDVCEQNAVQQVFGDRLISTRAYKSLLGHCLGAAGSLEVAISLLDESWSTQVKTSLGFGGHLNVAILGR